MVLDRKVYAMILKKTVVHIEANDYTGRHKKEVKTVVNDSETSMDIPVEEIEGKKIHTSFKQRFESGTNRSFENKLLFQLDSPSEPKSTALLVKKSDKGLTRFLMNEDTKIQYEESSRKDLLRNDTRMMLNDRKKLSRPSKFYERVNEIELSVDVKTKLEQAIYALPPKKVITRIKYSGRGFMLECILLFFIIFFEIKNNLALIEGNIQVLMTSNGRLFRIVEMNRRVRLLSLYEEGIFEMDRYANFSLSDAKHWTLEIVGIIEKRLFNLNNEVRDSLQSIEESLQTKFYDEQIVWLNGESQVVNQTGNGFDMATNLLSVCQRLSRTPSPNVFKNNTDIRFILDNTMNGLLLASENFNEIIVQDNQYKFSALQQFLMIISALIFTQNVVMVLLFLRRQIQFARIRNHFIDIFLRISDYDIEKAKRQILAFKILLQENEWDLDPNLTKGNLKNHKQQSFDPSFQKIHRRSANMSRINFRLFIAQGLILLLVVVIMFPFVALLSIVIHRDDIIKDGIKNILFVGDNLYELDLLMASTYEYITTNGMSTVRNRPIEIEIPELLETLLQSDFYPKLITQEKNGGRTQKLSLDLEEMIKGNVCHQVPPNQYPHYCRIISNELLTRGITAMDNFILAALDRVLDEFEHADYSVSEAKRILEDEDLIAMEFFFPQWGFQAHERVIEILQADILTNIVDIQDYSEVFLGLCIASYLVFGLLISNNFIRITSHDRDEWKKMFRKIPFNTVASSQALKGFLVHEKNGILDSVKSQL